MREINSFEIQNGSIVDPMYAHEVHSFFYQKFIEVIIILPGIIKESLLVNTSQDTLELTANIHKKYRQIYKADIISLKKKLPVTVRENVIKVNYECGMLNLSFIKETSSDGEKDN